MGEAQGAASSRVIGIPAHLVDRLRRGLSAFAAPPLVAVGLVVGRYGDSSAHWSVAVRPAVVALAAAIVLQVILQLVRQPPLRSAAITILLLLVARGGPLALAGIGFYGLLALWTWTRTRRLPRVRPGVATALAAAFLGGGFVVVASHGNVDAQDIVGAPQPRVEAAAFGPSIYVLLLDGYARQDTLRTMGFDNEPFLTQLEHLGFDVYRDSRSNYTWTGSTLASMLNMRPIDEIGGLPPPGSPDHAQTVALRRAIDRAAGLRILRSEGYRIVSIPSVADPDTLRNADEVLDSGHLTEFEIHLLQSGTLAQALAFVAPDFIGTQHRDRIRAAFASFASRSAPTFMLAHVLSPHHPFVFDAQGIALPMPACFPRCWFWEPWDTFSAADYFAGYLPQVQFVNRETLSAVERLIAADPGAVVVIMSDHGSRAVPDDAAEPFRNLLAVRSPGYPRLLGAAPTPVNLLGAILGAYLNIDVRRWPDDQFEGRHLDAERIAPVR